MMKLITCCSIRQSSDDEADHLFQYGRAVMMKLITCCSIRQSSDDEADHLLFNTAEDL